MTQLAAHDLQSVLDLSLEAGSCSDLDEFRAGILPTLRRLVPCIAAGYNEVDPVRRTTLIVNDPSDAFFDGVEERFGRWMHQHPMVAKGRAGDGRTYMLSDFFTVREFHHLELYQDMYRLVDAEDQIAFSLLDEGMVIGVAMNRSRRSFTDRDRAVLELLRPHLAQAYRHVRDRMLARVLNDALEEALEDAQSAVIVLDRRGRVLHTVEAARELFTAYFGSAYRVGAPLPSAVQEWLGDGTRSTPVEPLTVFGPRGRLVLRKLPRSTPDQATLIVLAERRPTPLPLDHLQGLGLTPRQAQVMRLIAMGKDLDSVANELFISRQTVRKHLERIYAALGVDNRTAAVARVLA